jgi:hypothetical protein
LSPLVVAIGLDSFDPERFEVWSKEGHLPHLDRLRREGAYCRLGNPSWYRAEQGWSVDCSKDSSTSFRSARCHSASGTGARLWMRTSASGGAVIRRI